MRQAEEADLQQSGGQQGQDKMTLPTQTETHRPSGMLFPRVGNGIPNRLGRMFPTGREHPSRRTVPYSEYPSEISTPVLRKSKVPMASRLQQLIKVNSEKEFDGFLPFRRAVTASLLQGHGRPCDWKEETEYAI